MPRKNYLPCQSRSYTRVLASSGERGSSIFNETGCPFGRYFVAVRYLLPCDCGGRVPVELRQAGESVVCRCGRSLAVPTLLELKKLEQETGDPHKNLPRPHWGQRQQMGLLGMAIFLTAVGFAVYLALNPIVRPPFHRDLTDEVLKALPPLEILGMWRILQAEGISPKYNTDEKFDQAVFHRRLWWGTVLVLGAAGVVLMVGPAILRARKKIPGSPL
jgi:hypothetical protein